MFRGYCDNVGVFGKLWKEMSSLAREAGKCTMTYKAAETLDGVFTLVLTSGRDDNASYQPTNGAKKRTV